MRCSISAAGGESMKLGKNRAYIFHGAGVSLNVIKEERTAARAVSEKLVSPTFLELLNNLKLAVAQLRLYPKDSPQVAKMGTAAYQSLTTYLEGNPKLVLGAAPTGLLINGQRLTSKDFAFVMLESSLISFFLDAGIKSITFRKGASLEELLTFLDALVKKFWDVKEGKEINRRLQEERVMSISVDEFEYVAVGEGDLLIKDATKRLEKSGSKVSEIMKTLDLLIEAVVDPDVGADGRLEIMKKLLEADPTLLEKAKAEPLARSGRVDKVPGLISLEKGREAVGELARQLRDAPEDARAGLRKVGNIVIDAFRHDPRLMALMRQFLSSEAADMMPVWMTEEYREASQDTGPAARANVLLALAADEQAEPLLKEAASLVRELLAISRTDLAARILARLTGLLMERLTERRRAAAEALLSLHPAWEGEPLAAAREGFETLLRTAIEAETDAGAYDKLAEIAAHLADGRLRRGEPELALETLSLLRRHHGTKDPGYAFRVDVSFQALQRVTRSVGFPMVLTRLRNGDPVALRVAESLGDAAAALLVEEIKKLETASHRIPFA